ncbi:hypothetical protein ASPTUDRAFT_594113 [Aspergillus tubingensis CBS 134.48]|uniref:Uncharacterized protein n=1 Tax=Aspergillus tubingensis (strain CBS 134.48) TaxID=767770 RepID=A0A1L9N912_ASPTC|nr:hypothetical protein ASPTUDRAFT_594113 [Aspergillus tubingensis CBS 134.48]
MLPTSFQANLSTRWRRRKNAQEKIENRNRNRIEQDWKNVATCSVQWAAAAAAAEAAAAAGLSAETIWNWGFGMVCDLPWPQMKSPSIRKRPMPRRGYYGYYCCIMKLYCCAHFIITAVTAAARLG